MTSPDHTDEEGPGLLVSVFLYLVGLPFAVGCWTLIAWALDAAFWR